MFYKKCRLENISMEKPTIAYPCIWPYKIVGEDGKQIANSIAVLFKTREFRFSESNQSKTGKYISFDFLIEVKNEQERYKIFDILKDIPTVKIIL